MSAASAHHVSHTTDRTVAQVQHQYRAIMRCDSSAHIPPEEVWAISVAMDEHLTVQVEFRTEWRDAGLDAPVPGMLSVEATGPAESAEAAMEDFLAIPPQFVLVMAFACNSYVGMPVRHVVLDVTEGVPQREFIQAYQPMSLRPGLGGRRARPGELMWLLLAVERHPERGRLTRAMEHYRRALDHWCVDDEWIALAHLFIAAETLTHAFVKQGFEDAQLQPNDYRGLAVANGISVPDASRAKSEIEAWFRRERVFRGDVDAHRAAKKASDGFEHGYLEFPEIQRHARESALATFGHVRSAIIDCLDLPEEVRTSLLDKAPLDTKSLTEMVMGHFSGDVADLPSAGEWYPYFEWSKAPDAAWVDEQGVYHYRYPCELGPLRCAEGIHFTAVAFARRHDERTEFVFGSDADPPGDPLPQS